MDAYVLGKIFGLVVGCVIVYLIKKRIRERRGRLK